ncbi:sodium:solute symporter family protein [Scopulibacillus cellulosilyticus]|uniref:Sodium:solute symporter n=1 Tax=Scopulibacillus cellulosilyticus TaxID=2665665 RepID=A0ABW2Q4M7_9BACL
MNIALVIIFLVLLLTIYLGVRARKGKDMNLEQWAVGGRNLGSLFVFLLMAGETFTTFTFLGGSGLAYASGGPAYYVFNAGYFVVSYWLLPPIWKYAKQHRLLSQSDFFAHKYNSNAIGVLVGIVGVVAMIPYLVLQLKGLGIIVSETSYGVISPTVAIWIGMIVALLYVLVSGVHGSAWTSVIKDAIILIVIIFMGIYLPLHYFGGFKNMFETIHTAKPGFITLPHQGLSPSWFVSTLVLFTIGAYMWPHAFSAAYTSKSGRALRRNAIAMPLYQIILVSVIFIGFAAAMKVPGLKDTDMALFEISKRAFSPWFVGVIGAAGALAALVPSSLLLMASATILSKNVYKVFRPKTTDQQLTRITRILMVVVAIIALFFTFHGGKTIASLLVMGYSFVTQLFPSLVCSLWKRNPVTKQGAFVGVAAGVVTVAYITITGTTVGKLLPFLPQQIKDFDVGVIALVINIFVTAAVSVATRKKAVNVNTEDKVSTNA